MFFAHCIDEIETRMCFGVSVLREARSDSCQPDAVIVVSKVKLVIPETTDETASLRLICSAVL
jgi:hypothetical protein